MIGRGRFNEALAGQNARLRAALDLVLEYLDNRADVIDGDYGMPAPNREMRLIQEIQEALCSKCGVKLSTADTAPCDLDNGICDIARRRA